MTTKKKRTNYPAEFKGEALKFAAKIGVSATAKELKIHDSQIYGWRAPAQKSASVSEREAGLATEVAKLKRQLAEQTEDEPRDDLLVQVSLVPV